MRGTLDKCYSGHLIVSALELTSEFQQFVCVPTEGILKLPRILTKPQAAGLTKSKLYHAVRGTLEEWYSGRLIVSGVELMSEFQQFVSIPNEGILTQPHIFTRPQAAA